MKYSCKCQTCLSKMEMKLAGLAWFYVLSWGWFCSSSVKFKVSFIVPQSDSCKSIHLEVSAVNLWEKSLRRFASTVVVYAHKEQWQCKQLQVMLLFMQSHCSILYTLFVQILEDNAELAIWNGLFCVPQLWEGFEYIPVPLQTPPGSGASQLMQGSDFKAGLVWFLRLWPSLSAGDFLLVLTIMCV